MTVVFVTAMATGCVGDPDASTRTQGVAEGNAIASNAIASNALLLNAIASNAIASNQISNHVLQLASTDLITTADGRELLTYVVSCAIPAGTVLVGTFEGVTYEFPGDIGLAPGWTKRSIGETDQRWVSACLIARVNRFGIPVTISIRGPHRSLTVTEAEASLYSVEEGSFYGNVFRASLDEPLIWNACRGRDQAASESGTLDLRDCAEPDPDHPGLTLCGFNYAGDCADWAAPANAYACKKFKQAAEPLPSGDSEDLNNRAYHGGYYEECYNSPSLGQWQGAERFSEVITVFLTP